MQDLFIRKEAKMMLRGADVKRKSPNEIVRLLCNGVGSLVPESDYPFHIRHQQIENQGNRESKKV